MKTILILWFLIPDGQGPSGSVTTAQFDDMAACVVALDKTRQEQRFLDGVCVEGYSLPVKPTARR